MSLGVVDNYCTITFPSGLVTDIGTPGNLDSGKEDNDGVSVVSSSTTGVKFNAQVKRKAQSSVADSWNSDLDETAAHMNSYQWLGSNPNMPDELNFFFTCPMTIGGSALTLYLGQGSYGTTNNWWIGCTQMQTVNQVQAGGITFVNLCMILEAKSGKLPGLPTLLALVNFSAADEINLTQLKS